jgi:HEAT repeats
MKNFVRCISETCLFSPDKSSVGKGMVADRVKPLRRRGIAMALATCLVLCGQQARSLDHPSGAPREQHQDPPMLWVAFRDGLLSVQAKQGAWTKVLNEVSRKTGILFHRSTPLQGSVSLSFKDLPLKRALERLFGPEANFVFRYPEGVEASESLSAPKEVWVLGKIGTGVSALPQATSAEAEAESDPLLAATDETVDDQAQIDHLVEWVQNEDPGIRLQALLTLAESGSADEGTVRSALESALSDENATVRSYAIQIIAQRGGRDALGYLSQALHDDDAEVRAMAVRSIMPKDQGVALLKEALADLDEGVRSMAAYNLEHESQQ